MLAPTRVLIIDDEVEAASLLGMHFERDGYEVLLANSGSEGLRQAYENNPDAIILDVRMPGMDGHEVCGRLRDLTQAVIIFVTVVRDSEEIVRGLEMGADDYLIKPYEYPVLRARMEAGLRRKAESAAGCSLVTNPFFPWSMDRERREIVRGNQRVQLTPKEFDILEFFMRHPNKVLAVDEILSNLWGPEYVGDPDLVKQFVYRLRSKLETNPSEPRYLVTVRGSGYAFEPDTTPTDQTKPPAGYDVQEAEPLSILRDESIADFRARSRRWSQILTTDSIATPVNLRIAGRKRIPPLMGSAPPEPKAFHGFRSLLERPAFRLGALLSVSIVALAGGYFVARASSSALPGDALYSAKRGLEEMRLAIAAGAPQTLELQIAYSEARVDEIEALVAADRPQDILSAVQLYEHDLGEATQQMAAWDPATQSENASISLGLLQALITQRERLESLGGVVGASPALLKAAEISRTGIVSVQRMIQAAGGPVEPTMTTGEVSDEPNFSVPVVAEGEESQQTGHQSGNPGATSSGVGNSSGSTDEEPPENEASNQGSGEDTHSDADQPNPTPTPWIPDTPIDQ